MHVNITQFNSVRARFIFFVSDGMENWTCQEYLNDDRMAADYVGCDTSEMYQKVKSWHSPM